MKWILGLLFVFLNGQNIASANMLDKVQLEEAIQRRIETHLKIYDNDLQARVRFVYKNPIALPGTTLAENEDLSPNVISESDIRGIEIEIQTKLSQISDEMQKDIYTLIPIRKSRIKLKYLPWREKSVNTEPPPLVAKDFWDISKSITNDFSKLFLLIVAGSVCLLSLLFVVLHFSQVKNSKENFGLIAKSILENINQVPRGMAPESQKSSALHSSEPMAISNEAAHLELSTESLVELFADCYWCEEDAFAHWLWKNLSLDQKKQTISAWPLLKKYSLYFVSLPPEAANYHQHPYYMAPEFLAWASQEVLQKELKNNPDLWLRLSPMRQIRLQIPIAEKLRIVKKGDLSNTLPKMSAPSKERVLPMQAALGDLSFEDESTILKKPDMISSELRGQLKSLVWLSLQKPEFIQETLSRFDALSLATAWTGSPEVLQILEKQLPEKKVKLLLSYKDKVTPSKKSETYMQLFRAGLHNEAA